MRFEAAAPLVQGRAELPQGKIAVPTGWGGRMSLRIRLSLIVSMLFLTGVLLGLAFLISNARQRVMEEVESAASLTYQLLDSVLLDEEAQPAYQNHSRLLERLKAIEYVRHLDIRIAGGDRSVAPATGTQAEAETGAAMASREQEATRERGETRGQEDAREPGETREQGETRAQGTAADISEARAAGAVTAAPAWFVYLVRSEPVEYSVALDNASDERIVIRTNPADEIAEVWLETRNFMLVLLLVLLLIDGLLYFTLGRWLAPVSAIVAALEDVEHGDFSGHVSQASLPELKVIAEKLNQLTAVLRTSKQENDRLTRRSLMIQENERRHLARELHDEMGQSISAIKAIAFSIAQRMQGRDEMSAEGAGRIGAISSHVSDHVRSMMSRLRPAILDEMGLIPALQVMIDEWNKDHRDTFCSFQCSVQDSADFGALDGEQQISLYRIIQEALTNVARHATADRVDVALSGAGRYRLVIVDNGCGYDPHTVQQGMGLSGIRERCQALNGQFSLSTGTGAGVRMEVEFS